MNQLHNDPEYLTLPGDLRAQLQAKLKAASDSLLQAEQEIRGERQIGLIKQDIWERRLLDLSYRNSLLNIRTGRRAIAIDHVDIEALEARLCRGEEIPVSELFSTLAAGEYLSLIKGLFRIARESLEESGANTLYLSFGTLCFTEDGSLAKMHRAPIMLLPVNLVRCSKEKYILLRRDEEETINTTLVEYLKQTADIQVSQELASGVINGGRALSALAYMKEISSSKAGWSVEETCFLGVFSFTKYVMWNDIHAHREVLSTHPVLQSLIEGRLLTEPFDKVDARSLDSNLNPNDLCLPLDYDSSQLEAVAESDKGSSFIICGPPGTGKSQTISNIIANALFKGRRVLFVAEKKAALEVVQRRLEKIGIGKFCLELHSNKIDKKSFLTHIQTSLSQSVSAGASDSFLKSSSSLYSNRIEIISQINALHCKGENGLSLSECIERFLSLPGNCFPLPKGWTCKMREDALASIKECCLSLDAGQSILGMPPSEFPLFGFYPKMASDSDRKSLVTIMRNLIPAIDAAQKQEASDVNRKYSKKSFKQILVSDYRWRRFSQMASMDDSMLDDAGRLNERIATWVDSLDLLPIWERYLKPVEDLKTKGLGKIVDLYYSGLSSEQVFNVFLKSFYLRAAQDRIESEPRLSRFNGILFSQVIERYIDEANRFQKLAKEELLSRLTSKIPQDSRDPIIGKELAILKRRIASKGRGTTIREIMDQIPHLLPSLCPCMLMSPLSIAKYLPVDGQLFDLVVFDEASQMPTCEAIGSIARARSVIVVGDPKQMPPTDFFASSVVDEDEYEVDDLESILDDCLALSMPIHNLTWHYRSHHESLIKFSNREFYEGTLVSFPSVDDQVSRVIYRHVDGVYDFGNSRCNRIEAESVVDEALKRLGEKEDLRSIGIIAFSKAQSNLVEDILWERLAERPDLEEKAFRGEEPLFVKNLENVQGDERDVILFSIGYGPDKNGHVSMNFGPLNKNGGERRLNVAVTRARDEMVVFSSLTANQIDTRRTNAEGALGLMRFLKFAAEKHDCAVTKNDSSAGDMLSQIASSLATLGYAAHTSVGDSSIKLDLAVVDPLNPNRYCLGIIVDGDNYCRLKTVRDREIVRPAVLNNLGWNLSRIWILDWFLHPEQVMLDVKKTLQGVKIRDNNSF